MSTDPSEALAALGEALVAFSEARLDTSRALDLALDQLLRVTAADAGAVAVPAPEGDELDILAERRLGGAGPVSRTSLSAVLHDPAPEASILDPPPSSSIVSAGITSILCAPVRRHGRTLAAVYLDRRGDRPAFDETARTLTVAFAATLALALDLAGRAEQAEAERLGAEQRAEEALGWAADAHDFWRFGSVVTKSDRFARCLASAERAARYNIDLLIQGETGTGKEHLARLIHQASGRKGRFVAVNCTALPESIAENELFGHEAGAYTGATGLYRGSVEQASGGTLFLDEIGDLPPAIQPKLLRVLESKAVRRIGGEQELALDLRIVAATNKDLEAEVEAGRFRADLYYRLRIVRLTLPPLRERLADLPELGRSLLRQCCEEVGRYDLQDWSTEALRALARYRWPGNIRELKNLIKQLCVLAEGPELRLQDLAVHLPELFRKPEAGAAVRPMPGRSLREHVHEAERQIVSTVLRKEGSVAAAARYFGISRQSLHNRCIRLGLQDEARGSGAERR